MKYLMFEMKNIGIFLWETLFALFILMFLLSGFGIGWVLCDIHDNGRITLVSAPVLIMWAVNIPGFIKSRIDKYKAQ